MIETPTVVETRAQLIAIVHIETPRSKMQQVMGPGIGEVMSAVKAQGIGPTGPWFTHHLKMTSEAFDFDICVPVSAPAIPIGRVKPGRRPAINLVRTVYHGPYEGLAGAWHEFGTWVEANGRQTSGDLYECYLVGPETSADSADWRTELSRALVDDSFAAKQNGLAE
jgi:effector-binding domain-containing protein